MVGQTITYYVNVTNTGDTTLYYVVVFDSLVGVIAIIPELGVDETVPLTYTYVVPGGNAGCWSTRSAPMATMSSGGMSMTWRSGMSSSTAS